MLIKVIEKCLVLDDKVENYDIRTYVYETTAHNFDDAVKEIEENFDCNNIIENTSNDNFEGECLDSEVILYIREDLKSGYYEKNIYNVEN